MAASRIEPPRHHAKKALDLLSNLKTGQELLDQLEYIDFLVAHAPPGKFHNPPGLYISAVQQNGPVPDTFLSSRKRRISEEAKRRRNDEHAHEARIEMRYNEYRRTETERFIRETLDPEEYQALFEKMYQHNRRIYKQMTPAQLNDATRTSVANELRESGPFPYLGSTISPRKRLSLASDQ